jgi:hypothetical protein
MIKIELFKKIINDSEGEVWCISKRLLTAFGMRFIETGTKLLGKEKREETKSPFEKSYRFYLLFWQIKSGLYSGAIYPKNEKNVSEKERRHWKQSRRFASSR